MNIFYISHCPYEAAKLMVDRHVVKMILETAQLLSTAHRVLDGKMVIEKKYVNGSSPIRYRNAKRWKLDDDRDTKLYAATHVNHPSAIWCRINTSNYNWLNRHFIGLLDEYTYRYGKTHKCADMIGVLGRTPNNILLGEFTEPTPAMDNQFIVEGNSLESYRNYYKNGKVHLHKWTKRNPPDWI
jgi:hypothetical protein